MKNLYILRGVSGSGKTTLAKELEKNLPDAVAYAADDYHYDENGNYNFDVTKIGEAHLACRTNVQSSMGKGKMNIIVHNTNTTEKEIRPYVDLAERLGYNVVSLVVENRHGNTDVHSVPSETKERQERRLKSSIKLS
jgi:predicted kinase